MRPGIITNFRIAVQQGDKEAKGHDPYDPAQRGIFAHREDPVKVLGVTDLDITVKGHADEAHDGDSEAEAGDEGVDLAVQNIYHRMDTQQQVQHLEGQPGTHHQKVGKGEVGDEDVVHLPHGALRTQHQQQEPVAKDSAHKQDDANRNNDEHEFPTKLLAS